MTARLLTPAPWTEGVPCAEVWPDLWFPERGDDITAKRAREICRSCHSRLECLSYALTHHEEGVWGGYTEHDRRSVASRLRAGESLAGIVAADDAAVYQRLESAPDPAGQAREHSRRARERNAAKVAALTAERSAA